MIKRKLGTTELICSVIGLGSGEFGSRVDVEGVAHLLDRMVELGGNLIDTAKDYGDWVEDIPRSASEKAIGKWLRSCGLRDQLVVATKGCLPGWDTPEKGRCSGDTILRHIDSSRDNLGVETIDLWYVHKDDPAQPMDEMLQALHEAKTRGMIRHYGASNISVERLEEADRIAEAMGWEPFQCVQGCWNMALLGRQPYGDPQVAYMNRRRAAYHTASGRPWISFQSTAYGLFHRMREGTLDAMNPGFRSFYRLEESEARYHRAQEVARQAGMGLTEVVLAYLYSNPRFPTFAVVGSHKPEQVEDNFRCGNQELTPEQIEYIECGSPFGLE